MRKSPWKAVPEADSAAPTMRARHRRGILIVIRAMSARLISWPLAQVTAEDHSESRLTG